MSTPICSVRVRFVLADDIVAPPFTSKVSRSLLAEVLNMATFKPKSLIVSPVLHEDRPLFKTVNDGRGFITLKADLAYSFRVVAIGEHASKLLHQIMRRFANKPVKLFTTKASILDVEVSVRDLSELSMPDADFYRLDFLTPTVLQLPTPREPELFRKLKGRPIYLTFPDLRLIFWSLARHWNEFAPSSLKVKLKEIERYALYAFPIINHKIRAITAMYGRKGPRAFLGWIYCGHNRLSKRLDEQFLKLLEYANWVGIGKSRSIGFGMTKVEAIT